MESFKLFLERKVDFFDDKVSGGRAKASIAFSEPPPRELIAALQNALDKQGMEVYNKGKLLKFYQPSNHVNPVVYDIAKQIIHRHGWARFNDAFPEDADELFGWDLKRENNNEKLTKHMPLFNCEDCKQNLVHLGEFAYIVNDNVWNDAGKARMLCVKCLEKRIGRQLTKKDFEDMPLNNPKYDNIRSNRLKKRMQ